MAIRSEPHLVFQGVEDKFESWSVHWLQNELSLKSPAREILGPYAYFRIVLPIEIASNPSESDEGHVILRLDPVARIKVLNGVSMIEIARFKRRLSGQVLAAV